jgi:hypothetical protein
MPRTLALPQPRGILPWALLVVSSVASLAANVVAAELTSTTLPCRLTVVSGYLVQLLHIPLQPQPPRPDDRCH